MYIFIAIAIAFILFRGMEKYREYNTGEITIDPNASVFEIVKKIEDAKKKTE